MTWGFAVDDLEARVGEIEGKGYEIISDAGVVPVKFRATGGTIVEFALARHFDIDESVKRRRKSDVGSAGAARDRRGQVISQPFSPVFAYRRRRWLPRQSSRHTKSRRAGR